MVEEEKKPAEEQEIDLLELAMKLWDKRKFIIKWMLGGVIAGLIIAFSIPKEYTTKVVLAPEIQGAKTGGSGLSSLASLAGINLNSGNSSDAMTPMIYPDIVSSVPFNVELFDVAVTTNDAKDPETCSVREYIEEKTSGPWWGAIISLPFKAIGGVMSLIRGNDEEEDGEKAVDPFRLTKQENEVVMALQKRIAADVDQKTAIITVNVTMQDPMVSAMLADTVVERLKTYVTNYRTEKARHDLEYAQLLHDEAQKEYFKAQQAYANYADRNQNIALRSGRIEMERLQNEAQLRYNVYNSTAQQLQLAKAKVQEMAPVYTVVEPATVALKASKPSKMMILVGFTFLAFVIAAAWVLYGKELWAQLRSKAKEEDHADQDVADTAETTIDAE